MLWFIRNLDLNSSRWRLFHGSWLTHNEHHNVWDAVRSLKSSLLPRYDSLCRFTDLGARSFIDLHSISTLVHFLVLLTTESKTSELLIFLRFRRLWIQQRWMSTSPFAKNTQGQRNSRNWRNYLINHGNELRIVKCFNRFSMWFWVSRTDFEKSLQLSIKWKQAPSYKNSESKKKSPTMGTSLVTFFMPAFFSKV